LCHQNEALKSNFNGRFEAEVEAPVIKNYSLPLVCNKSTSRSTREWSGVHINTKINFSRNCSAYKQPNSENNPLNLYFGCYIMISERDVVQRETKIASPLSLELIRVRYTDVSQKSHFDR